MSTPSQGHHKRRNRVKDPQVAFDRGMRDAAAGRRVEDVPYRELEFAKAWEAGWREYYNSKAKRN